VYKRWRGGGRGAHQWGVETQGDVLRRVAPDEGQEEDVEGEAERGEDGYGHHLERVVGQLPPVLPHYPLPPVSFFSEEEGDGRQCPAQARPRTSTEKQQAGTPQAPCAGGAPLSFPIPKGKASAPLRRSRTSSGVPGSDQKRIVFLRFVWLFLAGGMEWPNGGSSTSGNGERG
jgi:hypothetical protein